ncbi:MAG: septum formation initiator family protein [Lachnospiraceae bacterium]|nr:septum formation initiator family protein [Lachnospiraceae bacterium]
MPRRRSYRKLVQRKFTLFLAMVVIFLLLVTLAVRSVELWQIQKLYLAEEQVLKEKIAAEEKRGEEITEYEKYTQTKKYVEEVAKDKLGLVNKDEIIFKEE